MEFTPSKATKTDSFLYSDTVDGSEKPCKWDKLATSTGEFTGFLEASILFNKG